MNERKRAMAFDDSLKVQILWIHLDGELRIGE